MREFSYDQSPELKRDDHVAPAAGPQKGGPPDQARATAGDVSDQGQQQQGQQAADQKKPLEYAAQEKQQAAEKPDQAALGDGVSEELRAYREARRQETPFYDPVKDFTDSGLEESADAAGITGEERDETIAEQKRMLADFNMSTGEAKEVVGLVDRYAAAPPDAETSAKWGTDSWNMLVRQHGEKEAHALLNDALKLAQRDPRTWEILNFTKLRAHPKIIAKLVSEARSERGKGRLK
jgi:hypothetical protein